MAQFKRHGTTLFYEVSGEGAPIIFTHGASWNHYQWDKQVEYFKNNYRVITWDVRGHGYSSLPYGPVDSLDFSDDLIALMDHLNLKEAILCGFSMGGHISLQVAIKCQDRIKGLILIGTICSYTFNLYEKILIPISRFFSRVISIKIISRIQAGILSKFNPSNYQYIVESFSMISHDNWVKIWSAITRMESKNDLYKVKCKTLLLVGDHDYITNYQQSCINKHIANSELKVIKNSHHGANLDNPDAVNFEISKFIDEIK